HKAVEGGGSDLSLANADRAFRRRHESAHRLQQCGFAATRRAQDHVAVALMNRKVDTIRGRHQMTRRLVLERYALCIQQRGRHQKPPSTAGQSLRRTLPINPPTARLSLFYFVRWPLRYDSAASGHSVKELFNAGPDVSHSGSADGALRRRP